MNGDGLGLSNWHPPRSISRVWKWSGSLNPAQGIIVGETEAVLLGFYLVVDTTGPMHLISNPDADTTRTLNLYLIANTPLQMEFRPYGIRPSTNLALWNLVNDGAGPGAVTVLAATFFFAGSKYKTGLVVPA